MIKINNSYHLHKAGLTDRINNFKQINKLQINKYRKFPQIIEEDLKINSSQELYFIMKTEDETIVGEILINKILDREYYFSYLIYSDRDKGKGIMKQALLSIIDYLYKTSPYLYKIKLKIALENIPSKSLADKLKFRVVGIEKKGLYVDYQWTDTYLMEYTKDIHVTKNK